MIAIRKIGFQIGETELNGLFSLFDTNNDGRVSYSEMCQ
jgi:Ca2+-binding EF-hand superfamily protein